MCNLRPSPQAPCPQTGEPLKHINLQQLHEKRISIHKGKGRRWLTLFNIAYVKGDSKASSIADLDETPFADYHTLAMHEELLSPYVVFLRIHKSYIVNIYHVIGYIEDKRRLFALLINNIKVPLSKNKQSLLVKHMNMFVPPQYQKTISLPVRHISLPV